MVMRNANINVTELPNSDPQLQQLFDVQFEGTRIRTTVTFNFRVIIDWINHTRDIFSVEPRLKFIVGVGVQWHPNWKADSGNPADTLQLCVDDRCLIIQLSRAKWVPCLLRQFLNDPQYTFVGIQNNVNVMKLERSVHQLTVNSGLVDLLRYSYRRPFLMETMAADFLGLAGVRNDPRMGTTRWNARFLSKYQAQYACVNAYVAFLIAHRVLI